MLKNLRLLVWVYLPGSFDWRTLSFGRGPNIPTSGLEKNVKCFFISIEAPFLHRQSFWGLDVLWRVAWWRKIWSQWRVRLLWSLRQIQRSDRALATILSHWPRNVCSAAWWRVACRTGWAPAVRGNPQALARMIGRPTGCRAARALSTPFASTNFPQKADAIAKANKKRKSLKRVTFQNRLTLYYQTVHWTKKK